MYAHTYTRMIAAKMVDTRVAARPIPNCANIFCRSLYMPSTARTMDPSGPLNKHKRQKGSIEFEARTLTHNCSSTVKLWVLSLPIANTTQMGPSPTIVAVMGHQP